MDKKHSVDEYISKLEGQGKEWTAFFVEYMRKNHNDLEEVISFQMPTFKLGSGKERNYIAFSPNAKHFSLHTMDFEYIVILKEKLSRPGKGKGCVNVSYDNLNETSILTDAIEEIVKRKIYAVYGK